MAQCEACLEVATKVCGYDGQPMLNFCLADYVKHLHLAHPFNEHAQTEANELERQRSKWRELGECGDCDGCGWVEGGKCLQTTCKTCKGTGYVERRPAKAGGER